jgi:hypothetical protein
MLGCEKEYVRAKVLVCGLPLCHFFLFFNYLQANEKLQSFQGAFSFVFWFLERESAVFCFCVQLYPLLFLFCGFLELCFFFCANMIVNKQVK